MTALRTLITTMFFLCLNMIYAQCDSVHEITSTKLISDNAEEVEFSLCYEDSSDFLIVKQYYKNKSSLLEPKLIKNTFEGDYLLQNKRIILFTTDKSKFQLKLVKEEKTFNFLENDDVVVYSYYEASRKKLKFILLNNVNLIDIVKDNEIQTFEITYPKAVELYQMTYQYFKWKGWK